MSRRELPERAANDGAKPFGLRRNSMKYLPLAFLVGGLATHLSASSITILNPSFEDQIFSPGTGSGFPYGPITGWTENQIPSTAYSVYNPATTSYPGGAPNGANVAQILGDGPTASISQILSATLQPNDTYTFTGYSGLRADDSFGAGTGCGGADAAVEAGGNILTPTGLPGGDISCNSMTVGSFTKFTFTFSTGANPAGLGDPLEIVLTTQGTGSPFEPTEIDFDNITLSDTLGSGSGSGVPEPATFGTMAGALGICVVFLRRQNALRLARISSVRNERGRRKFGFSIGGLR